MLALPSETSPVGFIPSATLLVACWAFLTAEAFLIAQVNISLMNKRRSLRENQNKDSPTSVNGASTSAPEPASDVISLRTMAEETLGPVGSWVSSATYVFLSYTLLIAYVAKAADVLSFGNDMPLEVASGLFVLALGGLVYAGNTETTDWANRIMTAALLVLFASVLGVGSLSADWTLLSVNDWSQAPSTLPILFLSLVYHDLIPVICSYLEGDVHRVRLALALGGAGPLVMFLLWDAVALSVSGGAAGVDPLDVIMSLGGSAQAMTMEAFSLLAVMTSFLGTALSMSEFFIEQLGNVFPCGTSQGQRDGAPMAEASLETPAKVEQSRSPASTPRNSTSATLPRAQLLRAAAFALVLVPSWAFSCSIPDAFFAASEAAGAYGMTVLYGIFPPLMFWKWMQTKGTASSTSSGLEGSREAGLERGQGESWGTPAGGLALGSMAACAFSVMVSQAILDTSSFRAASPSSVSGLSGPAATVLVLAATPVSDIPQGLPSPPLATTCSIPLVAPSPATADETCKALAPSA